MGLFRKSQKNGRKESVDSKQKVRLTLNASSTFSGCVTAQDESAVTSCGFATSIPQASGTGSGNPPLPITHTAVTAPKGLLVAAFSESADLFHALTSPCLQYALSINAAKSLQTTFSGCVTAQDYSADVR